MHDCSANIEPKRRSLASELPARLGVTQLAKAYSGGRLSPVDVVRHTLQRIDRPDPVLNSYLSVTADHALERARQAESEVRAGRRIGPPHGVPYAARNLLDTRGSAPQLARGSSPTLCPRLTLR
ncbi:MAG: hypothetical protein F4Y02_05360 [Chloroflexi bacterium]|nr:hypothetical protein [Chloroflexota bacterium]